MIENKLVGEFKRPRSVEFKQEEIGDNTGVFVAKPYERGFATTVGNSLRRTLLSSISGHAIVAVKFDCINNEFQNIPGVLEDTTTILANFRNSAVRLKDDHVQSRILHFEVEGKKDFKVKDLVLDETIDVGNPEFVIFTANKEASFSFDLQIEQGRGYVPGESFQENIEIEGTIPVDADFSPILNVAVETSKTRVGTRNDYEEMKLTIKTTGVITPENALKEAAQILKESYMTFNNMEVESMTSAVDNNPKTEKNEKDKVLYESIFSLELNVASHYFLKSNDFREIGQLVLKTADEIKEKPNCNDGIIENINDGLKKYDLELGMKNISYTPKTMV